jgi:hypothetical protein
LQITHFGYPALDKQLDYGKCNSIDIELEWKEIMNEQPTVLDFVKAMSDAERLRFIGALVPGPGTAAEIASQLGIPVPDAFQHLEHLAAVGVLRKTGQQYELDIRGLEALSKAQFAGQPQKTYVPAPGLDDKSSRILKAYLNPDGSIKQIPSQGARLRVVLEYLAAAFQPGLSYSEREVNTIIRRFHLDTAGLRRDLVDAGLLARLSDGSSYWRTS